MALSRRRIRSRRGTANLAEFAPALIIFFMMTLFPLLDMLALAWGASTVALVARQSAMRASQATTYEEALQNAKTEATNLANSNFGRFARLVPIGGSSGSGVDLYVNTTEIANNKTMTYGPNSPVPPPVDTANKIYEYTIHVNYQCGPFVNLACVPGFSQVPGLGKPADLGAVSNMAAEFAEGCVGTGVLASGASGGGGASGAGSGGASYGGTLAP